MANNDWRQMTFEMWLDILDLMLERMGQWAMSQLAQQPFKGPIRSEPEVITDPPFTPAKRTFGSAPGVWMAPDFEEGEDK